MDPMTTETAEMFMRQRDDAIAGVERLRAKRDDWKVECAFITDERDAARLALQGLVRAVAPVLRAHRSEASHVTVEQITAAWAAYDEARRTLQ